MPGHLGFVGGFTVWTGRKLAVDYERLKSNTFNVLVLYFGHLVVCVVVLGSCSHLNIDPLCVFSSAVLMVKKIGQYLGIFCHGYINVFVLASSVSQSVLAFSPLEL